MQHMNFDVWLFTILSLYAIGALYVVGIIYYMKWRSRKEKEREAAHLKAMDQLATKIANANDPNICKRCLLRPIEPGGSMCTWCGI